MKRLNGEELYTVVNEKYLEYCVLLLKNAGVEFEKICDIYYNSKFQNANNLWYIVKLEYVGKK